MIETVRSLLDEGMGMMIEQEGHLPTQLKRCVRAVAQERGLGLARAFPICVASLQKKGYLKAGSLEPTAAGEKRSAEKEGEKGAGKKFKEYEKLLKAARKKRS